MKWEVGGWEVGGGGRLVKTETEAQKQHDHIIIHRNDAN